MDSMRKSAYLVVKQITVYSYGFSLIARRWVRFRLNDDHDIMVSVFDWAHCGSINVFFSSDYL